MSTLHVLTRRDEGIFDGIALNEITKIFIRTLEDISIQGSYSVHSSNGCGMFYSS